MLRSFAYAAGAAYGDQPEHGAGPVGAADPDPEPWTRDWQIWTSAAFLRAYLLSLLASPDPVPDRLDA
jgi:predicted trehalose synthase